MENKKDTTLTAITSGSKYFSNVRSPATSHTQTLSNPFRNLTNKVRGKIFYKEVFLRLPCMRRLFLRLYHRASIYYCFVIIGRLNYYCIGMYPAYIRIFLHDAVDDYITLISLFAFLQFHSVVYRDGKVDNSASSVFFFCWLGLVVCPWWGDSFVYQNAREFCASRSTGQIPDCAYTTCSHSQNLLHSSQWISFPTQLGLVLYSLCTNLLYSLMWLIV